MKSDRGDTATTVIALLGFSRIDVTRRRDTFCIPAPHFHVEIHQEKVRSEIAHACCKRKKTFSFGQGRAAHVGIQSLNAFRQPSERQQRVKIDCRM